MIESATTLDPFDVDLQGYLLSCLSWKQGEKEQNTQHAFLCCVLHPKPRIHQKQKWEPRQLAVEYNVFYLSR